MFESKVSLWLRLMERAKKEGWIEKKTVDGKTFGDLMPSPPDERDWPLVKLAKIPEKVPDLVSFDHLVPCVLNQGDWGTCVSKTNTTVMGMGFKEKLPEGGFSTLYNYVLCKQYDGEPDQEGTYPRTSCKISAKYGNLGRERFPYIFPNGLPQVKSWMHEEAAPYKIKAYARLGGIKDIEQAMAMGKVCRIAILVTESFLNWIGKGLIGPPEGKILGFHEMAATTYDRKRGMIRGPNSWGTKWGKDGFYELSYEFCEWEMPDLPGFFALMEAWAVDFESPVTPGVRIELWDGKPFARVNGQEMLVDPQNADVAPFIVKEWGRMMGPYRFIAERLGARVDWDETEKKVTIYK